MVIPNVIRKGSFYKGELIHFFSDNYWTYDNSYLQFFRMLIGLN